MQSVSEAPEITDVQVMLYTFPGLCSFTSCSSTCSAASSHLCLREGSSMRKHMLNVADHTIAELLLLLPPDL